MKDLPYDFEIFENWLNETKEPITAVHTSYYQKFGYGTFLRETDFVAFRQEYFAVVSEMVDAGELTLSEEGEYIYA